MQVGKMLAFLVALAAFAGLVRAEIPKELTGAKVGATAAEAKADLDTSKWWPVYDGGLRAIPGLRAYRVKTRPGFVPSGETFGRAVAVMAKTETGWRVVGVRIDFKASPEAVASVEARVEAMGTKELLFFAPNDVRDLATIVGLELSPDGRSRLAVDVLLFWERLADVTEAKP